MVNPIAVAALVVAIPVVSFSISSSVSLLAPYLTTWNLIYVLGVFALWRQVVRPLIRISLKDRIVLVTGADSGIGAACVKKFLNEGAIVFAGCLQKSSVDEWNDFAKNRSAGASGNLIAIQLDVTSDEQCAEAVEAVKNRGAPFAAIVNNAGVSAFGFAEALPLERYRQCIDVNYMGTVRVTKAFLPLLRRDKGRMVMIGSAGDRNPAGFGSAYLSSKAAVAWFTESLRQEMARFGVLCPLVEPGFFATNLLDDAAANGKRESSNDQNLVEVYGKHDAMMAKAREPIEIAEKINGGISGTEAAVGGAVVDAASSKFPLARNVVGIDANLGLRWVPYLPTFLLDAEFAIRHRSVHPDRKPKK